MHRPLAGDRAILDSSDPVVTLIPGALAVHKTLQDHLWTLWPGCSSAHLAAAMANTLSLLCFLAMGRGELEKFFHLCCCPWIALWCFLFHFFLL